MPRPSVPVAAKESLRRSHCFSRPSHYASRPPPAAPATSSVLLFSQRVRGGQRLWTDVPLPSSHPPSFTTQPRAIASSAHTASDRRTRRAQPEPNVGSSSSPSFQPRRPAALFDTTRLALDITSVEAWLSESVRVMTTLANTEELISSTTNSTVTAHTEAADETRANHVGPQASPVTSGFHRALHILQDYARFLLLGRHLLAAAGDYGPHFHERASAMEQLLLQRLGWLKSRFDACAHDVASCASPSSPPVCRWPWKEEVMLRCLLVAARTPRDTAESLDLLALSMRAVEEDDEETDSLSAVRAKRRTHVLLFAAKTLSQVLHNLADGAETPPRERDTKKKSSASKTSSGELCSLSYVLFTLCVRALSLTERAPLTRDITSWQTDATDAFCATPSDSLLLPPSRSAASLADVDDANADHLRAGPPLLFPVLSFAGALSRCWSPHVGNALHALTAESSSRESGQAVVVNSAAHGKASDHEQELIERLTNRLSVCLREGATAPTLYYRSPLFTPYWSFCLSSMLRESWRALDALDAAPTPHSARHTTHSKNHTTSASSPKHKSMRAKQSQKELEKARAFHAVGSWLSFRRMASSLHRHGRVLAIVELHRMVTGNASSSSRSDHGDGDAASLQNTAFLEEAARYRARLVGWSVSASAETAGRAAPTSVDALLWREAVLFDAYTLTTIGHVSEGATDLIASADTRASCAAYLTSLQTLCMTHLLQLEAVEHDLEHGTHASVLQMSHPVLWSLLTPRTRDELRRRLREGLRLGAKCHLRLGNTAAVRDLYVRCPSMGGSWEVGKSLLAAHLYEEALVAFQSLLRDLTHTSHPRNGTAPTMSASHVVGMGEAGAKASWHTRGIPHTLKKWLLEAVKGAANTRVPTRFAAFLATMTQRQEDHEDAAGPVVLLSESALWQQDEHTTLPTTLLSSGHVDSDGDHHRLAELARELSHELETRMWPGVREGCTPLPPAVWLDAILEGILAPAAATTQQNTEHSQVAAELLQGEVRIVERAYSTSLAASFLATRARSALAAPSLTGNDGDAEDDGILRDGLLQKSVLGVLEAGLNLLDMDRSDDTASVPNDAVAAAVNTALTRVWDAVAEVVAVCPHLNLLVPCVVMVVSRQEAARDDARTRARLDQGLHTLVMAVLGCGGGGAVKTELLHRTHTPATLSDAYLLAALSSLPRAVLALLEKWSEDTSHALSSRGRLLLHAALAAKPSTPSDDDAAEGVMPHDAQGHLEPYFSLGAEVPAAVPSAPRRAPWRCVWCQTWNRRSSSTCKQCAASIVSLVQCEQCGAFNTTLAPSSSSDVDSSASCLHSHACCVVCQGKLAPRAITALTLTDASTTGTPRTFPLRAWTCSDCHSRNTSGHIFYCATCGRMKPELEPSLKMTAFTCAHCHETNPLGMLKPWCGACGTLAPVVIASLARADQNTTTHTPLPENSEVRKDTDQARGTVAAAGPSLWYCLQCGQLNPWTRSRCESCEGHRTRHQQHAMEPQCAPDVTLPWQTIACASCQARHPAWCWKSTCRDCGVSLRTSSDACAAQKALEAQWRAWWSWAWRLSRTNSPASPSSERARGIPASHVERGCASLSSATVVEEDDAITTEWPSASSASSSPHAATKNSHTHARTARRGSVRVKTAHTSAAAAVAPGQALDVHFGTAMGWVCWACDTVHTITSEATPAAALLRCACCKTAHAAASVSVITSTSTHGPSEAVKHAEATATVFILTDTEVRLKESHARASPIAACSHCGASAEAVKASGVCTVCGEVCTWAGEAPPSFRGGSSASSSLTRSDGMAMGSVRLRLLLHEMASAATWLASSTDLHEHASTASSAPQPTHTNPNNTKRTKKGQIKKGKKNQPDKGNLQRDRVKALRTLTTGARVIQTAPKAVLPWTHTPCDVPTRAHRAALEESRTILNALAAMATQCAVLSTDGLAAPLAEKDALPIRQPVRRSMENAQWQHCRPWLCAALDIIDAWTSSTDTDEIGFAFLRRVCLAIRPEQHAHIEQDTRWQYLASMRLTRTELVGDAGCCAYCLSRDHKTGEVANCRNVS